MTKRVDKYFKKAPAEKTVLVQARVPIGLVKSLKPFMTKYELTWTRLVSGALENVYDSVKGKK